MVSEQFVLDIGMLGQDCAESTSNTMLCLDFVVGLEMYCMTMAVHKRAPQPSILLVIAPSSCTNQKTYKTE